VGGVRRALGRGLRRVKGRIAWTYDQDIVAMRASHL